MRRVVRGEGPGSLYPIPARSYEQTCVNRETSGWTKPQSALDPPSPVSRMTDGVPAPVHQI